MKRYRNDAYLGYVRGHACCSCLAAGPSEAHHFGSGGMGRKADDTLTVPLCRTCHQYWHDRGRLPGYEHATGRIESERTMYKQQAILLSRWVAERGPGSDEQLDIF